MVTSANSEMAVEPPISNVRGSGLGSAGEEEDLEEDEVRVTVAPAAVPSPLRWSLTAPSSPSMNPTATSFIPSERLRPRIRAAESIRREEQIDLRRNQALRASLDNVRDAIEDASRGLEGILERLEGAEGSSTSLATADSSSSATDTTRTIEGMIQRRASYSPPASIGDSTWRTLGGASLPIPGVVATSSSDPPSATSSNPALPRATTAPASIPSASSSTSGVTTRSLLEERMRRYRQQQDQEDVMTRWTIINDLPPLRTANDNRATVSNNNTSAASVSSSASNTPRTATTRTREELDAQIQRILDHGRRRERERERANAMRPREEVEREEMERRERNARMDADIERILSESRAERRRRRRERRNRLDRTRNEYEIAEEEEGEVVVLPDLGDPEEESGLRTVLAGHGIRSRVGSSSGEGTTATAATAASSTSNPNGLRQMLLERMARMRRMNNQASEEVMMRWDMEDAATDEQEIDDDDMMDVDEPDDAGRVDDMIDGEAANIYSTRFPSPFPPPSPPPVLGTMSRNNHQDSSSSSSSLYRYPAYSSADFDIDSTNNEMSPKALKKHEEAQRRRLSAYGKVYYRPDLDIAGMCFDPSGERMYVLGVVTPQDDVSSEQGGWGDDNEVPRERGGGAVVEWKINGANKMWFVDGPGEGWF